MEGVAGVGHNMGDVLGILGGSLPTLRILVRIELLFGDRPDLDVGNLAFELADKLARPIQHFENDVDTVEEEPDGVLHV